MNMMEQIWKVRDSRGLDIYEKSFLSTIASRGEAGMFCEWKRNTEDMGMKKDRYYKTRKALLDKDLITAQEQPFGPTIYKINDPALIEWYTTHSATQNAILPDRKRHSVTQNGHSVSPERKKNIKKNKEEELTEEQDSVADAPSCLIDKNKKDKDEEDFEGAPRPPASLIGPKEAVGPMVEENPRHSVTQNGHVDNTPPWWADPYYSDEAIAARKAAEPVKEELVW